MCEYNIKYKKVQEKEWENNNNNKKRKQTEGEGISNKTREEKR